MFRSSREGPTEGKAGGRTSIWLGTALVAAVGLLLGPLALASSASAATTPHATTPVMGAYVPVTPFRLVDTRTGAADPATYAGKTLAAATSLNVQVGGVGVVPTTASAAVLNVTATNTSLPGFLAVYPEGTTQPPLVSNLNFTADETVANLVTVPLSATGMATIYNSAGNTDVLVDVEGYYTSTAPTNGAGLYNAVSPVRVLGTLAVGATVAPNTTVPVTVAGTTATDAVPASAIAVVLSATAAHGSAASFLSVYPAPAITTEPTFSNVNFSAGEAVANRVTVAVGTGGQIEVYNHSGTVDVDIDVDGYYTAVGGTGSVFVPLTTPVRVADTRTASVVGTETPIAANASELFNLATAASGIPTTATSVVSNFTVISGDASGYLSIYPTSTTTHPVSSSVNWTANEIVPDFTIADTNGTGSVEVYNSYGTINLVVDVFGYFESYTSGPLMVSAVVTDASIVITYNEGVTCPVVPANLPLAFTYDWTGSASGGAVGVLAADCTGGAATATPDVLTLLPAVAGGFTAPGTGATLTYNAGANRTAVVPDSDNVSVFATSATTSYEVTQTLAVSAQVVPAMVSAIYTASTVVLTYNEDVICPNADAATLFTYTWTGQATDGVTGCTPGAFGSDTLTLALAAADAATSSASVTYTVPAAGNTATSAVYAKGTAYVYAATQTLTTWTPPAITTATVTAGADGTGVIAVTYSEAVACPTTAGSVQADFEYTNGGAPAYPSTCGAVGDVLTLGVFYAATTGTTATTLVLPGAADTLIYTVPATNSAVYAPTATVDYPQFPAAQKFALAATVAPTMVSAVVNGGLLFVTITYNEAVSCPATGADGDFVYDSGFNTLGGAITSCASGVGFTLILNGVFNAATGSASIVYTAPATSTSANAVYAAGSTSAFAATQTLLPL